MVGVVREGVEREGVIRGGVEMEVVGDCWGRSVWKGRVRVESWYRLRTHTRRHSFGTTVRCVRSQNVGTAE